MSAPNPTRSTLRGSPAARRIGAPILGTVVVVNLALLTYSLADQLSRPRVAAVVYASWALGVLVLVLLIRDWRRAGAPSKIRD